MQQGTEADVFNPDYLGGRDKQDHSLRATQAKTFVRLYLKSGVAVHIMITAMWEA
jgi:hypothetical protein